MENGNMEKSAGMPGTQLGGPVNDERSIQGIFLPIAILMVAVLLTLGWNLYLTRSQAAIWQKQISQREQLVNQARVVQADLQKIASDLMALALTDAGARAIVDRYQIRQDPVPNTAVSVPKR